ncbi:autoinducer binding domain-containing protein [Variovorax sp. LjRoot290]|uniref:helix-turn-helix transcriptional regulator n=1 Tax=unclassified Variovorax TaxID=663243 RepID=UPI003ECC8778
MNAFASLIRPALAASANPRSVAASSRASQDGHQPQGGGPPLPQFYSEAQLYLPQARPPHADGAPGFVGELLDAGSIEARGDLIRAMLHAIGFEWLSYGVITQLRGQLLHLSFFTGHANPQWTERYFSQRHHEVDPRFRDAPASGLPLVWDIDRLEASSGSAGRRQRFLADLRGSGIRSGVYFRLASPTHVNEHTVISLLSRSPGRDWITDAVVGRALVLGLSLHDYLSRHSRLPAAPAAARAEMSAMSATQQYVLQLLLEGCSDKEIAHRLRLSAHTVDYHMRQLRRRFAARNRVQLVNAASQGQQGEGS